MINVLKASGFKEDKLIPICKEYMALVSSYEVSCHGFILDFVRGRLEKDLKQIEKSTVELDKGQYTKLLKKENQKRIACFDKLNHTAILYQDEKDEIIKAAYKKVVYPINQVLKTIRTSSMERQTELLDGLIKEFADSSFDFELHILNITDQVKSLKEAQEQFKKPLNKKIKPKKDSGLTLTQSRENLINSLVTFTHLMLAQAMMDSEKKYYYLNLQMNEVTERYMMKDR